MIKITKESKQITIIDLVEEYRNENAEIKWAVVTDLTELELLHRFGEEIKNYSPYLILSVEQGEAIFSFHKNNEKFKWRYRHKEICGLSDEVVSKMNELLREVVVKGTGKKAINVAGAKGKTGTSQNYRDAWFIGSTDKYTPAVWVGNDDDSPMVKVGGSSLPVEIWADLMK